ncbi:MAG TPA: hypothetical protein VJ577_02465 [Burkholderiaceae bacterium]|nr:hypothetical protein [Burkholderiaceae bacterium]
MKIAQRLMAVIAILFGIATLIAGGRVLLGADPGYTVYRPLLVYNVTMGAAYIVAGILAWVDVVHGKRAAATIFILNCLVLAGVSFLYLQQGGVAVESLRAMTLRTVVWLALFLGLRRLAAASTAGHGPNG